MRVTIITTALLAMAVATGCTASGAPAETVAAAEDSMLRAVVRNRGDANLSRRSLAPTEARLRLREVSAGAVVFTGPATGFGRCEPAVTVSIDGEPQLGATYRLGEGAGLAYAEDCVGGTRTWRADEGALTVDALDPDRWSFSITGAHMAPSNHSAVGTFDLSVRARRVAGRPRRALAAQGDAW